MKARIITAGVVMALLTSSAFAFIGPPTAGLNQSQWSVGANYQYSTQDLDKIKVKWRETGLTDVNDPDSTYTDSGSSRLEVTDLTINRYYGRIGYGISDAWEVYGQLGIADVKGNYKYIDIDDANDITEGGVNFDNSFVWGVGTKYTFYKQNKVNWGVALQYDWLSTDASWNYTEEEEDYTETGKETVSFDSWNLLVAVGPSIDMGGWNLYGGALFSYLSVDHNFKCVGTWTDPGGTGSFCDKESGDNTNSTFGGYVGASFDVYKNCNTAIELSFTGEGWGAGVGIEIPF
jgi:opacity protein-like surface antigen